MPPRDIPAGISMLAARASNDPSRVFELMTSRAPNALASPAFYVVYFATNVWQIRKLNGADVQIAAIVRFHTVCSGKVQERRAAIRFLAPPGNDRVRSRRSGK